MKPNISRREFLKLSGLAASALVISPDFPHPDEQDQGMLVRVATKSISLYSQPSDKSSIISQLYKDQIVHVYAQVISPDAPVHYPNKLWYRVWGGYIHSAYVQTVKVRLNDPYSSIPESGMLAEVTVPYTTSYQQDFNKNWYAWRGSRLYYSSTHWLTGITTGPDGKPWYQITSELSSSEVYYAPSAHLRIIAPEEYSPISTDVPASQKRIEVRLDLQAVHAFEYDQLIHEAKISSGVPNPRLGPEELPTGTPTGNFVIYSKMPSKHMGRVAGGPEVEESGGFSLPGVPWTCFFKYPGGYAFHGTYWHTNFGLQMSHGCVNMKNEDALWLFRWTTPVFHSEIKNHQDWERTGGGTRVVIYGYAPR